MSPAHREKAHQERLLLPEVGLQGKEKAVQKLVENTGRKIFIQEGMTRIFIIPEQRAP